MFRNKNISKEEISNICSNFNDFKSSVVQTANMIKIIDYLITDDVYEDINLVDEIVDKIYEISQCDSLNKIDFDIADFLYHPYSVFIDEFNDGNVRFKHEDNTGDVSDYTSTVSLENILKWVGNFQDKNFIKEQVLFYREFSMDSYLRRKKMKEEKLSKLYKKKQEELSKIENQVKELQNKANLLKNELGG
jgi:hypothetical protein